MDDVFETTMHQPDGPVGNHPMQGVRVDEGTHAWMILEIGMPSDKIRGCSERLERVPKLPVNEKKMLGMGWFWVIIIQEEGRQPRKVR